jgi:peptidoglycan/xylan/chitin deacetylase (PgdA/CDA1 family)
MRLYRPGFLAGWLYPDAIFRINPTMRVLHLTFDDGPDPASTPELLDILSLHKVRAAFFCSGRAAEKYPDLMHEIHSNGHLVGNHGYDHLDGWKTDSEKYISDVARSSGFTSDKIFRPPYGRLSIKQKSVLQESYKIIFWDVMAYDFDDTFGKEKTLRVLKNKIRPGSIIVLHDTASSCVNAILEDFITIAINAGYRFELLDVTS